MATEYNLKLVVQAIDRATGPLRKVGQAMGEMSRRARLDVLADKLCAARERVAALGRMAHQARDSLMRMGAGALAKITAPLGLLSGFAIKTAAN